MFKGTVHPKVNMFPLTCRAIYFGFFHHFLNWFEF